jgi:ribosome maturation factor RimP
MGARRPFFVKGAVLADVYTRERELEREISRRVEEGLPGVEVLAVELVAPQRFCVYVDRVGERVDHALCERVTNVLRDYLRDFAVDVSSPGIEPPLRKPAHFQRAVGRRVRLKTSPAIGGRRNFRGELKEAGERGLTIGVEGGDVAIPYEAILRGNLIETSESR